MHSKSTRSFLSREDIRIEYDRTRSVHRQALLLLKRAAEHTTSTCGCHFTIKARVKDFESCYAKLLRKPHHERHLYSIQDLLGVRVVCSFLEDVKALERLFSDKYTVVSREEKGAEAGAREFGYRSLHLHIRIPETIISTDDD